MPKQKSPTAATKGFGTNKKNPIRQIQVTNGCRYYQVDMGHVSGKHIRKNFANIKKAHTFASQSRTKPLDNGISTVRLTGIQRDAMELLNPFNASLYEAACYYAEEHKVVEHTRRIGTLIQAFIGEREQQVEHNELQQASLVDIQHFLKRFSREFGDRAADQVTAGEIDYFLDGLKGIANRRSHRLYISSFFNWAVAQGHLSLNPVKLTRRVTKRSPTPKTYSVAEVEQIMKAAPSKLVPYLALGLFTGMRSTEILKLQWRDVDFDREEIRVPADSSDAEGRIIQLKPNLAQFLLPFRDEEQVRVVPHGLRSLQRWVKRLLGELGIKAILQGTRHTFTAFHLAMHPLEETMQELGFTDTVNLFKYCRGTAVDRQQAEAYFSILPLDQGEIIPLKKEAA